MSDLEAVLGAAPVALALADHTGTILGMSGQAERLLGYARHEVVGKSLDALVPERLRGALRELLATYLADPSAQVEPRIFFAVRRDGSELPVEMGLGSFTRNGQKAVLLSFTDVRERLLAEERFRLTVEAAPVAIFMVDEHGTIQLANQQATRILGYTREELLGMSVEMLVPARHRGHHAGYRKKVRAGDASRAMGAGRELFAVRKDGSEVPVEIGLSTVSTDRGTYVLTSLIDISARKQAEQERIAMLGTIAQASHDLARAASDIHKVARREVAGAQEQSATVIEMSTAVGQMAGKSSEIAARATAVSESAQRTMDVSREGREAVDQAIVAMETIKERVEVLAQRVLELVEQAQQVDKIVAAVKEIAEQTNLLALNAAIEAARAGAQGRGFAVVASEVKALAVQSKAATGEIQRILADVRRAADGAFSVAEDGSKQASEAIRVVCRAGDTIRELSATIADSAAEASQIAAATVEHAAAMSQIRAATENIRRVTSDTLNATKETEQAAEVISALGTQLAALTEHAAHNDVHAPAHETIASSRSGAPESAHPGVKRAAAGGH